MNKKIMLKKLLALGLIISGLLGISGCSTAPVEQNTGNENVSSISNKQVVADELGDISEDTSAENKAANENNLEDDKNEEEVSSIIITDGDLFEGYRFIEVDGGDQSGHREPNVVVDIGFGDREYYAFTNEYGQLVKVIAKKISLQDESTERVLSTGRYYSDEAKVPGVESSTLDEGHVIADSLGGVSNAYNITPQNSTLNRHGDQAYMEKAIRDAGGCIDFVAIITYPNNNTQIPSHYSYTYKLKGNTIVDDFPNVNPDEVNAKREEPKTTTTTNEVKPTTESKSTNSESKKADGKVLIQNIDAKSEIVTITNTSGNNVDMSGWKLVSVKGNQTYTFPAAYILKAGASITVASADATGDIKAFNRNIWNNNGNDPGVLYNGNGSEVSRFEY